MESHPEEDNHSEYETEADDALLCLSLGKLVGLLGRSLIVLALVLRSKYVLVGGAEGIVDGDADDELSTSHGECEVV